MSMSLAEQLSAAIEIELHFNFRIRDDPQAHLATCAKVIRDVDECGCHRATSATDLPS